MIAGVPPSPNVGLTSTGVPGGSGKRQSVRPLRSGSSSVTTIGTLSAPASAVSHAARVSAVSAAARSASERSGG